MKLHNAKKKDLAVNITPLIDVVFLLLIFFMVSTSFTRETQIKLELPRATGEQLEIKPNVIEVSIDAEGKYYVNKKPLINAQIVTLRRAISITSEGDSTLPLIISADAKAPYQSVVAAMDAAGQEGFSNLQMATRRPTNE
ncbi:MAG: biopolymer transporter ExbD [Gammaproteobacteria bacterium]|nr:biopolymer transporter ExbD [Gammaproteobacteria bacterium]